MHDREAEAVLITGVSWTGPDTGDRAAELGLLCQNLATLVAQDLLAFLGWR